MVSDVQKLLVKLEEVGIELPDALLPVVTKLVDQVGDAEVKKMLHQATRLTYRFNKGKISKTAYQSLMKAFAQTIKSRAKAEILEKRSALLAFAEKVWEKIIQTALTKI